MVPEGGIPYGGASAGHGSAPSPSPRGPASRLAPWPPDCPPPCRQRSLPASAPLPHSGPLGLAAPRWPSSLRAASPDSECSYCSDSYSGPISSSSSSLDAGPSSYYSGSSLSSTVSLGLPPPPVVTRQRQPGWSGRFRCSPAVSLPLGPARRGPPPSFPEIFYRWHLGWEGAALNPSSCLPCCDPYEALCAACRAFSAVRIEDERCLNARRARRAEPPPLTAPPDASSPVLPPGPGLSGPCSA